MQQPKTNLWQMFKVMGTINTTISVNRKINSLSKIWGIRSVINERMLRLHRVKRLLIIPATIWDCIKQIFARLMICLILLGLLRWNLAIYLSPSNTVATKERPSTLAMIFDIGDTISYIQQIPHIAILAFFTLSLWAFVLGSVFIGQLLQCDDENYYLINYLRLPAKKYLLGRFFLVLFSDYLVYLLVVLPLCKFLFGQQLSFSILLWSTLFCSVRICIATINIFLNRSVEKLMNKSIGVRILNTTFGITLVILPILIVMSGWHLTAYALNLISIAGILLSFLAITWLVYYRAYYQLFLAKYAKDEIEMRDAEQMHKQDGFKLENKYINYVPTEVNANIQANQSYDVVWLQQTWFKRLRSTLIRSYRFYYMIDALLSSIAVACIIIFWRSTFSFDLPADKLNGIIVGIGIFGGIISANSSATLYLRTLLQRCDKHLLINGLHLSEKQFRQLFRRRLLHGLGLFLPHLIAICLLLTAIQTVRYSSLAQVIEQSFVCLLPILTVALLFWLANFCIYFLQNPFNAKGEVEHSINFVQKSSQSMFVYLFAYIGYKMIRTSFNCYLFSVLMVAILSILLVFTFLKGKQYFKLRKI